MAILDDDRRWMELAIEQAAGSGKDVPVGCLIVRNGRIIGQGCNQRETTNDPTAHAEIIALRAAAQHLNSWRLQDCSLYTTLEPCPMCAEAVIQARVARLVFGAYDPRSGAAGSAFNLFVKGRIYPLPEVVGGIMEQPCQELLTEFFRAGRGET